MVPTSPDGGSTARSRAFSGHSLADGTEVWPIWHRVCRGVLFYSRVRVTMADTFRSADMVLMDGSAPLVNSPIRCGTCGLVLEGPWEISPIERPPGW